MDDNEHEEINNVVESAIKKLYEDFVNEKCRDWWWKEEDLHAQLYHHLIKSGLLSPERVFREYRLITENAGGEGWKDRSIGDVDLVILESDENEFSLENCKISHAIEIKFARELKDNGKVFTDSTQREFAKSFFRDYGKLWRAEKDAKNVIENFEKHLLFFEKFSSSKSKSGSRLFEREPKELFKNPSNDLDKIRKSLEDEEKGKERKSIFDLSEAKKWRWYSGDKSNWQGLENFDRIQFSYIETAPKENISDVLINQSGEPGNLSLEKMLNN